MTDKEQLIAILKEHKLRITDNRLGLLKLLLANKAALSSNDLEKQLPKVDRVTLYRTLKMFQEKGIIHKAVDGTEVPRYAICIDECTEHSHHDQHVHFRCTECEQTLCLNEVFVPDVKTPKGFQVKGKHMVVEGVCATCN